MTSTVIGADTSTQVNLIDSEYLLVLPAGVVRNTQRAVVVDGPGVKITNLGIIFSTGPVPLVEPNSAIYVNDAIAGVNIVDIFNDGLIQSISAPAIASGRGNGFRIINTADGVIASPAKLQSLWFPSAIYGGQVDLRNAGMVAGTVFGNSITSDPHYIHNSGEIAGSIILGSFSIGLSEIINLGIIQGNVSVSSWSHISNSGTIVGAVGINGNIENYGLIRGGVSSSSAQSPNETFLNAGTIGGNIVMSGGADFYDGREGRVFGVVYGDSINSSDVGSDADTLFGGRGAETLAGGGGDDEINAGAGDDVLLGDAGADLLIGGDGFDVASYSAAQAGVTANLADPEANTGQAEGDVYFGIEGLIGSAHADLLTGDAAANLLRGGFGADVLNGGAGADTLRGGLGGDVYFVDNAGDWIFEAPEAGAVDIVQTTVTYALQAAAHVEVLQTANGAGTGAINLTGSNSANLIVGNAGNNFLRGRGGADTIEAGLGNDTLWGNQGSNELNGGAGQDRFVFDAPLAGAGSGIQSVLGFSATDDTIALARSIYGGTGTGVTPLAASAFTTGTAATTPDHRVIYDSASGRLYFDANGSASGQLVQIGLLLNGAGNAAAANVSVSDFVFVG